VWLSRTFLKTSIEAGVKSFFDAELEKMRADLRASEERLKSDLRKKEAEIASLHEGALSGRATRQALIAKRRLEATDALWNSAVQLSKGKGAAVARGMMKMETMAKRAPKEPKLRMFLNGMIPKGFEEMLGTMAPHSQRPFISSYAWAIYSAYAALIVGSFMSLKILEMGVEDAEKLLDETKALDLVKAVLPNRTDFLDQHGFGGATQLLDEIEELLLQRLRLDLAGHDEDRAEVHQAAEIMKVVQTLAATAQHLPPTVQG
jgi:hypothetical protein